MERKEYIVHTPLGVPDTERECHRLKAFLQEENRSASGSRLCEQQPQYRLWQEWFISKARIYTLRNLREGFMKPLIEWNRG